MNFYQEGEYLFCIGGYGYSATSADHITYANLTAINVKEVINAVIGGTNFTSYFRQISDPLFQVTGGHLKKINNTYYLLGGQKFMGRYNPMGPNNGPGFIQEYTNAIRKFNISDNGNSISITHLSSYFDSVNLHRRDYNAEAQILADGSEGITMFSGVFRPDADLPFLNSVTVDSNSYSVNDSFQQYYNHYHCAVLPLFSETNKQMHTVFFGGIAQYYEKDGVLVQDDNVPFVKTIARVTRDSNGRMAEYKLPIELPGLMAAGAEFIPNENVPHFKNEVIKLDDLKDDSTLVGYFYGGINSTDLNIFFTNTGTESSASSQIFKVYVVKDATAGVHRFNQQSTGQLKMEVFPSPGNGRISIKFYSLKSSPVKISIYDIMGKTIVECVVSDVNAGENIVHRTINNLKAGGTYFVTIESAFETATRKIIVER